MTASDLFAAHFVEAALFADTPEEYEGEGLSEESDARLRAFATAFYAAHQDDIDAYCEGVDGAAHDLWYTLLDHGCGYWEQDDDISKRLDAAAKALATVCGLYEGDDGLLHWA